MSRSTFARLALIGVLVGLFLFAVAVTLWADEDAPGADAGDPSEVLDAIRVIEVQSPDDTTTYRCLYVYVDGDDGGGPAMWCERIPPG